MAEGGYDPCECYFQSQEAMMQRLLNLLREGQQYCTDTDCTDTPPLSDVASPSPIDSTYYMLALWAIFAVVLFFMRPSSMRRQDRAIEGGDKPASSVSDNNNNNPPPPPPVL